MEPDDARHHYSERLLTLPGLGTRYLSPQIPPASWRGDLGLPPQRRLYLAPQSLFKLHPDNDRIFVDITQRDPNATLVFFTGIYSGALRSFNERLSRALSDRGVATENRLLFLPMRSRADYLRVNLACEVMVDSLHWSGGNTSLDALHCRLPVVTCPGKYMRGRQTMAMLRRLDCAELIAETREQLVALAVAIANDRSRRDTFAARIAAHLAALTQSEQPLLALDAALNKFVAEV